MLILSSSKEEKNHKLEELLDTKYKDLFGLYIKSKEFENKIERLKEEDKDDFYIKNYRYLSYNFVISKRLQTMFFFVRLNLNVG